MPLINDSALAANTLRVLARRQFTQLVQMIEEAHKAFWRCPTAKPQDICNELGSDAAAAFIAHGRMIEHAATQAKLLGMKFNPSLPLKAFTVHEDGTVTISDEPYQP